MKKIKPAIQHMDERPVTEEPPCLNTISTNKLRICASNVRGSTSMLSFSKIREGRMFIDGLRLIDIRLEALLSDQKDVEDLIELLEIAKLTLPKNK